MLLSVYKKNKNTVRERAKLAVFNFKFLISSCIVYRETDMFVSSNQPLKIKSLLHFLKLWLVEQPPFLTLVVFLFYL